MHNAQAGKSSYAGGIVGYDYNTKDKSAVTGNVNNGAVQATVEGTSALLAAGGIIGRNDVGAVSGCRNFGAVACALHAGALVEQEKRGGQRRRRFGERHGTHRDELCGTGGWLPGRGLVVGHHLRGEIARQIINYLTERNLL
jgi:hypothetical protein